MRTPRFSTQIPEIKSLLEKQVAGQTLGKIELHLSPAEHHHLANVSRIALGETIQIIDSTSAITVCGTVEALEQSSLTLNVTSLIKPANIQLTLIAAIIKPTILEQVVDQATQIGVTNFCFYHAARSKFKLDAAKQTQKLQRFQKIAEVALKQSGTSHWPSFSFHENLNAALSSLADNQIETKRFILLADTYDAKPELQPINFTTLLSPSTPATTQLEPKAQSVDFQIIIGPEGGLEENEVNCALRHNFVPASLGQKTLRAETAAVVAAGVCACVASK